MFSNIQINLYLSVRLSPWRLFSRWKNVSWKRCRFQICRIDRSRKRVITDVLTSMFIKLYVYVYTIKILLQSLTSSLKFLFLFLWCYNTLLLIRLSPCSIENKHVRIVVNGLKVTSFLTAVILYLSSDRRAGGHPTPNRRWRRTYYYYYFSGLSPRPPRVSNNNNIFSNIITCIVTTSSSTEHKPNVIITHIHMM